MELKSTHSYKTVILPKTLQELLVGPFESVGFTVYQYSWANVVSAVFVVEAQNDFGSDQGCRCAFPSTEKKARGTRWIRQRTIQLILSGESIPEL